MAGTWSSRSPHALDCQCTCAVRCSTEQFQFHCWFASPARQFLCRLLPLQAYTKASRLALKLEDHNGHVMYKYTLEWQCIFILPAGWAPKNTRHWLGHNAALPPSDIPLLSVALTQSLSMICATQDWPVHLQ